LIINTLVHPGGSINPSVHFPGGSGGGWNPFRTLSFAHAPLSLSYRNNYTTGLKL